MMQNAGLSVGALLRSRREELGQDTDSVARQLRIRTIYLRAIEEGRIQDLPGATYAVGFVRSYADFLGFDGNSVVANFRDELGQRGRSETVSWQIDDRDGGFPFGKILVVLLVIAAAGYGLWYYLANTQSGSGLIEAVPEYLKKSTGTDKPAASAGGEAPAGEAPASQAANGQVVGGQAVGGQVPTAQASGGQSGSAAQPAGGPAGDGQSATTPQTGQSAPAEGQSGAAATQSSGGDRESENKASGQASATAPAAQPALAANMPAAQSSTTPSATAPANNAASTAQPNTAQPATTQAANSPSAQAPTAQAPTAPAQAAAGGEATPDVAAAASSTATRVSIHAKLESWVQINDKDGKPVLSRVLRAGETYAVPDEKGLVMNTGNAGGIDLMVDGKTLPSLGSVGLVKRNIVLDADKLATGNVTTEAPGKKPGSGDTAPAAPSGD